jgi:hypothetical protein
MKPAMDLMSRTLSAIRANLGGISLFTAWAASAALFAWGVSASGLFASYAPLSWVVGGFVGAAVAAGVWCIGISGHRQLVHNRYDAKLVAQGGPIDPLAKTFENRRIYLNDFALPSKPLIEGKTFIDCEIIGPANIVLISGNSVTDHRLPACDALVIAEGAEPTNGYAFRDCIFRGCSFVRITLLVTQAEFQSAKTVNWLRWISLRPEGQGELLLEPHYAAGPVAAAAE